MPHTVKTYKRLIGFTRPYLGRLIIGILSGVIVGGSLLGIFRTAGGVVALFENEQQIIAPTSPGPAAPPGEPEAVVPKGAAEEPKRTVLAAGDQPLPLKLAERFGVTPTDADGRMTWMFVVLVVLGLPFFAGIKALATFVNRYFMRWVGARVVLDIRNALFANLQRQSLSFYGRSDVGNLISRCTNDTAVIESAISVTVADLTRAPIEVGVVAFFIIYESIDKRLFGVLVGMMILFPLILLPIIVFGRVVKRYALRALRRISGLISRMQENITGIRVVKAFHMEEAELGRFTEMNDRYFTMIIRALRAELFMTPFMEFVAISTICFGVVFCKVRGITLQTIVPIGVGAVCAYRPLKQLARVNVHIQRSVAAGERIFELLDVDTALPEAADPVPMPSFKERIAFAGVGFHYNPDEPCVLSDISFDLARGHVVAFVGETGSGKTTVANLLARFYDPTAGKITMDGVDLRDIAIAELRALVGVVTQETILFNDTIAFNISYGTPNASPEAIIEAAKKANAHEFIMEQPDGYDRVVGEKGFVLSGGQRQRIAIARAILKNPPILILDEATSALDTVTERLVQEALNRLMANRTVFAIAHRLSTIKNADQILVLERGAILERGTHQELFEANGLYRHLCDIQFS